MGIISRLKAKLQRQQGGYINVSEIRGVQVYNRPTVAERLTQAKNWVKQKKAERALLAQEKETQAVVDLKKENARLSLQTKNAALKQKLQNVQLKALKDKQKVKLKQPSLFGSSQGGDTGFKNDPFKPD